MSYDSRVRHADYTSNWFDAEIPGLGELGEGVRHGAFSPPTLFPIRPLKGLLRAHPECRPNFGRIHHGPALDHRVELADVADVRRGIAIDQDEVGQFPGATEPSSLSRFITCAAVRVAMRSTWGAGIPA